MSVVVVVVAAVEVIVVIVTRPIHFGRRIVTLNAIHFDDAAADGSHWRLLRRLRQLVNWTRRHQIDGHEKWQHVETVKKKVARHTQ